MHRVYPMLFEAEKCTGWNRDSFFFVPDFGGKITEKRERERERGKRQGNRKKI